MAEQSREEFQKRKEEESEIRNLYGEGIKSLILSRQKLKSSLTPEEKKLYWSKKRHFLAREFWFIFGLMLDYNKIDLSTIKHPNIIKQPESNKYSKSIDKYDVNIVAILYLMKVIHTVNRKKWEKKPIQTWDLIVTWWLAFDKKYLQLHRNIWNKEYRDYVAYLWQLPLDYEKYKRDWDFKKLKYNNSFHKYIKNKWLKDKVLLILRAILFTIDSRHKYDISFKSFEGNVLDKYEKWFVKIVNGMPEIWRKDMKNMDYISEKEKAHTYIDVLNILEVQSKYKNKFIDGLEL